MDTNATLDPWTLGYLYLNYIIIIVVLVLVIKLYFRLMKYLKMKIKYIEKKMESH